MTDVERLDWMEKNGALVNTVVDPQKPELGRQGHVCIPGVDQYGSDNQHYFGRTQREAIDNAMNRVS